MENTRTYDPTTRHAYLGFTFCHCQQLMTNNVLATSIFDKKLQGLWKKHQGELAFFDNWIIPLANKLKYWGVLEFQML